MIVHDGQLARAADRELLIEDGLIHQVRGDGERPGASALFVMSQ